MPLPQSIRATEGRQAAFRRNARSGQHDDAANASEVHCRSTRALAALTEECLCDSSPSGCLAARTDPSGPDQGGLDMEKIIPVAIAAVAALGVSGCTKGAEAAIDTTQISDSIKAQEAQWEKDYAAKDINALGAHYAD